MIMSGRTSTSSLCFDHVVESRRCIGERTLRSGLLVALHLRRDKSDEGQIGVVGTVVGRKAYVGVVVYIQGACSVDWLWWSIRRMSAVSTERWRSINHVVRSTLLSNTWWSEEEGDEGRPSRTRHSLSSSPTDKTAPTIDISAEFSPSGLQCSEHVNFDDVCKSSVDLLRVGDWLEVQEEDDPLSVRLCQIEQNHGGYLRLTDGLYVHYLHERVHAVGWATSEEGIAHQVHYTNESLVEEAGRRAVPSILFETAAKHTATRHELEVGMRCELMDPLNRVEFVPAAITRVYSPFYFSVVRDSITTGDAHITKRPSLTSLFERTDGHPSPPKQPRLAPDPARREWHCHRDSLNILPATWCARNYVRIRPPDGYPSESEFSWANYRSMTALTTYDQANEAYFPCRPFTAAAFEVGTRLEVVDPLDEGTLLPATVTRTHKHIVWIRYDNVSTAVYARAYHCKSLLLFPLGHARLHGLRLAEVAECKGVPVVDMPVEQFSDDIPLPFIPVRLPYMITEYMPSVTPWSPPIYANPSCVLGPFLGRPSFLRSVHSLYPAAPLHLQLHTVLTHLLYASHRMQTTIDVWKSSSFYDSPSHVFIKFSTRRHSYARRSYRERVAVPSSAAELPSFLRHVLTLLDACPSLLSLDPSSKQCPYKCHEVLNTRWSSTTEHPLTGFKAQRAQRRGGPRGKTAGGPTSSLAHPLPNVKRPRRVRKEREAVEEGGSSMAVRRPVTRGVKLKLVRPHPHKETAAQQAAGKIRRNVRQHMSESRRSSLGVGAASPNKQRRQYTFAQIRDKPIGITLPRRKPTSTSQPRRTNKRTGEEEGEEDVLVSSSRHIPYIGTDPGTWSSAKLGEWLSHTHCAYLVERLAEEEIDGHSFMLLTLKDCVDYLQLPFGNALKLVTIVSEVKHVYMHMFDDCKL